MAVIEVRQIPILHSARQCDITESPVREHFQFVLRFGGIDGDEAPVSLLWLWLANRLPELIPFPSRIERAICFQCVSRADDFVILALPGFCGFDITIPKRGGIDCNHITFELGHGSGSGHGSAEVDVLFTIDTQYADDEGHLRGGKVLAYVADEVCQEARVFIIIAIRIGLAIDEIVETLKPYKTRNFIAVPGIIGRTDPSGICEHHFHVLNHHAVKHT